MLNPLCGLLQPLFRLSLAKTRNEDVVLCGVYSDFASIPRACPSLATQPHVGLSIEPRFSQATMIARCEDRERRQSTRTGKEEREQRQGTDAGNDDMEDRERRQGN